MKAAIVVPCATGMTLLLSLLLLKEKRQSAKYVIWPRIDQKTCLKCVLSAGLSHYREVVLNFIGLTPIIVENKLDGDELTTDLGQIEKLLSEKSDEILCVFSTSSCFAPRAPESFVEFNAFGHLISRVKEIAILCKDFSVPHLVNNAYGVQDTVTTFKVNEAMRSKLFQLTSLLFSIRVGRVDFVVQSTDKNFLVPVGGAIVACSEKQPLASWSELYPGTRQRIHETLFKIIGRASSAPIVDLFITLLSMGQNGYKSLVTARKVI